MGEASRESQNRNAVSPGCRRRQKVIRTIRVVEQRLEPSPGLRPDKREEPPSVKASAWQAARPTRVEEQPTAGGRAGGQSNIQRSTFNVERNGMNIQHRRRPLGVGCSMLGVRHVRPITPSLPTLRRRRSGTTDALPARPGIVSRDVLHSLDAVQWFAGSNTPAVFRSPCFA